MPDSSSNESSPKNEPATENEPAAERHRRSADGRRLGALFSAGVLSVIALVVAVLAVGLAGWSLLRQSSSSPKSPEFTEGQRGEAKAKICAAYDIVRKGVTLNTNQTVPGGAADVTGALAVAANARVSLYDGGQYLLARVDPATPPELADEVRRFGDLLMDIGAAATAGVQNSNPEQAERLGEADALNVTINEKCG